ncbi:hypothetical protein NXX08_16445 [Bacteroides fragilis]|nr:hypothetical protein [Bacteroides fragilis]
MKYIAITLGPITRTIEMAESTKELWAASYFFSYLAKKIVEPFVKRIVPFSYLLLMKRCKSPIVVPVCFLIDISLSLSLEIWSCLNNTQIRY